MSSENHIVRVWVETPPDEFAEIDYLGTFTDDAQPGAIVRDTGEMLGDDDGSWPDLPPRGREFRFFVPANPDYPIQDWQRAEDYGYGWSFIGVIAKAQIRVNGISQTICSSGLWGVESDSGEDYIYGEIGRDQLSDLRNVLESLGFSAAAINRAFESVERK